MKPIAFAFVVIVASLASSSASAQTSQGWKVETLQDKNLKEYGMIYTRGECAVLTRKDMTGVIAAAAKSAEKKGWLENARITIKDRVVQMEFWQTKINDSDKEYAPQSDVFLERCVDHVDELPVQVQELLAPYMLKIPGATVPIVSFKPPGSPVGFFFRRQFS